MAKFILDSELEERIRILLKRINAIETSGDGSGDMLKSVYDTNSNGIVDNSEALDGKNADVSAVPYTVVVRDSEGRAKIATPLDNQDIANKQYVDEYGEASFLDLSDTPESYEGQNGKVVRVKSDESGLEFSDPATPSYHHITHEAGGADAIKLDDLASPDDNTDLDVSTAKHGLCPKAPSDITKFLRGDGVWGIAGDMLKSVYDPNNDGVVTDSEKLSGRPASREVDPDTIILRDDVGRAKAADPFNDTDIATKKYVDTHSDMLKSVYDKNGNGIVDNSETLDGKQANVAVSPNTIILRDGSGRAKAADPFNDTDIATKKYVDTHSDMLKSVYDKNGNGIVDNSETLDGKQANVAVSPNTIILRDGSGRAKAADPFNDTDIATKKYVDDSTISSFLGLTDTPDSYSGQDGKIVKVNSTATALEFGTGGDMLKSIYDTNNNGIVDNSEKVGGRTIYVSDVSPTSADGQDGDIWFEY